MDQNKILIKEDMKIIHITIITTVLLLTGCNTAQKENNTASDSAVPDNHFTDLFMGECGGFTGSDGTYSVQLPDGRTVWIFGDTFIEGVNPDNTRQPQDPIYVRNSIVVQDNDSLRTLYNIIDGKRASLAIPPLVREAGQAVTEDSVWFWPGDGFVAGDEFKLFFSEFIKTGDDMWDFAWNGTWIASYSLPCLKEVGMKKLFTDAETNVHFGHAVHEEKQYTYVYGAGDKRPHAARFPAGNPASNWEFFDGEKWSSNISEASPILDIQGSEQFSVFKTDRHYVLITQMDGLSNEICSFTSLTPYGPWGNKKNIYTTPLPDSAHNLFTYNAVAHPQFTEKGMLLISYNTNSFVLEDHFRDATMYRPRFFRVPIDLILKETAQKKNK